MAKATTIAKELPDEVVNGTIFERNVPIDKMFVAERDQPGGYARPLNSARLRKLDKEFDRKAVGCLLLSMRNDGRFAVIDGHHRSVIAKQHGVDALDAYVYIDLTLEEEARLYRQFGDYLRQTPRDKWFAALVERQPEIVALNNILAERGLRIVADPAKSQGIAAVESILRIARTEGVSVLIDTLDLLIDAYDHRNSVAFSGFAMIGAAMFLHRFGKNPLYNRKRLVDRMQRLGVLEWETIARAFLNVDKGDKATAFGKALLKMHDSGRGMTEAKRLGQWLEKPKTEAAKETARRVLAERALPAAKALRLEAAIKKAQEVACPICGSRVGEPCTGAAGVMYHQRRAYVAAAQRKAAAA